MKRFPGGFCGRWAVTLALAVAPAIAPAGASALTWSAPRFAEPAPYVAGAGNLKSVSCPSEDLCVAADASGHVFTSSRPTSSTSGWRLVGTLKSHGTTLTPTHLSCASRRLCAAVDRAGDVLTSSRPGEAGAWKVVHLVRTNLNWITCPSARLCVAVGARGTVLTSTRPAAGKRAWHRLLLGKAALLGVACASQRLCELFNAEGSTWRSSEPAARRASAWSGAGLRDDSLTAMSCPSTALCVAVDQGGTVRAVTKPLAVKPRWTSATIDGNILTDIDCPADGVCVAVDTAGNVLSAHRPAGGRRGWRRTKITSQLLGSVTCGSTRLCVALSDTDAFASGTPQKHGSWNNAPIDSGLPLGAVSCLPTGACAASTGHSPILFTPNASSAAGPWFKSGAGSAATTTLTGLSCPSRSLCIAVDGAGEIVTSQAPFSRTAQWTATPVSPDGLTGVSCPSTSFCLATDGKGRVVNSTNPTGGTSAWSSASAPSFQRVSCVSPTLCIGAGYGAAYASQEPTGGAGAWTTVLSDVGTFRDVGQVTLQLDDVSCGSAQLCATVDEAGDAFWSTTPTKPGSWSELLLGPSDTGDPSDRMNGVSCTGTRSCTAVDNMGQAFSATPPPGWATTPVDPGRPLEAVSCPTSSLCVAVDGLGNAIVGRR